MVRSTLTLLALFNVAILFPGKAMSQNSEGREFNGKYQKEYPRFLLSNSFTETIFQMIIHKTGSLQKSITNS